MVLREPGSITRRTFDEACVQAKVNPRVLLELDSREAVTEAVAAQLGVGVVSSVEVSHDPRVAAVPIMGEGLVNRHNKIRSNGLLCAGVQAGSRKRFQSPFPESFLGARARPC